jgi:acetylornithine aminotransferase/acetylornithine/N-succinyldiaminopimelate aminotransferase
VVSELLAKGILINRTHETVLRFLPPYTIEKKHVDEVAHALDLALANSKTKSKTTKDTKVHEAKRTQSERGH